ncbi:S9 family peptidase [Pseudoduganella namucuonensis]|uniref:Dipeptidyl-peptidase IV Serine peptidase. MEROPS family S09B n=1 Tax=Pseudoduganella namucuonensis TaxID=1035707 RepID=A0A1I7I635_9BURK|nr:S9 family peptidase [Pseudoduganella namucuonensis]SFU68407.1 dipeptidyl-peptidase IV Serine peptidase. MEROPS family S09B [Pseudoduganella namucuonensis]
MRFHLTSLATAVAMTATLPVSAERLTLDRIHGDPALAGAAVRGMKVSPDGARVTFLRGRDDNQFQQDLWEFNIKAKTARRLVDSQRLAPDEKLSDAEKARRERERTASLKGILSYSWSPDGKQLLVPIAGDLYLIDAARPDAPRLVASGNVLDPKISPMGRYLSFVRNQNLVVIELATGQERQLTTDGAGTVHNGEAEFIAQEEMGQRTGYYWAPDDSAIAYKRYDEAQVPVARRFEIYADRTDVVEQRYPAAGDPNATVQLRIVSPATGEQREVDLGADKDIYLVRADWSANGKALYYQRQTRDQKTLELVAVDAATLRQRTVVTEKADTWTTIHDDLRFLRGRDAFIWSSERSGRNHLYLYSLDGKLLHPISKGDWGVDNVLAVDEKAGRVYVAANRDAVIDKQTYALALDGGTADQPKRITQADGWHESAFSRNGEVFVDTWSSPDTPPQISIRRADGAMVGWLEQNALDDKHPYAPYKAEHLPTEFGTIKAQDGQTLHYALIKPRGFDASKRYPVYLSTYGGPHAQHVGRKWGNYFDQYMAQQGYLAFRLDNRGSWRRERAFTDAIHKRLGEVEVQDQLAGVEWLGRQSYVDPKRIGVFGWSYGGFMTLRLLAQASDKIAMGVSVAPVTDWKLYDTHYTERFMGKPADNAEGYRQSSVFAHVDGLKSPLLLVHGMADDNVLFTNTTRMIDALVNRNVQFELMTYPGAKHGMSGKASQRHVYGTIESFFKKHLKPE